ncbi:hypothetical protein NDU88_002676 [Pleurodeles waltl]|uniref:Uncharacterized protein n=1 Tax=Pleurodeles waltl TaxID=8319 RepID=A0AAV7LPX4_PLEWA|nr:hypothetical protein NDU88_002676 [Pleurodeles waltl]
MRAISGQSGTRERVGDRGLPLGATEPPLRSRGARTRLPAKGEVRGLSRDPEPGPCVRWRAGPGRGQARGRDRKPQ